MTDKPARGGSFCGPVGSTSTSTAGTPLVCTVGDGQTRARWRSADGHRAARRSSATPRRKPTILEMNRRQLRDAAKAAGIQLKRGEPDDAIRVKLSDARDAATAARDIAAPKSMTEPHPWDGRGRRPLYGVSAAGGGPSTYCSCGLPYLNPIHTNNGPAGPDLSKPGLTAEEPKPAKLLADARDIQPVSAPEEQPTMTDPAPAADSYGVADYRQPLTAFERQAGVVEPERAPVDVTRRTARPAKLNWQDSQNGMFHTYSASADALRNLGQDTQVDMGDGVPLQDLLTDVAMDTGSRKIPAAEAPARYRAIAARLPEGSRPRRVVESLAAEVDGPPVEPMQLPEHVDPAVRDLVRAVEDLPAFRNPSNDQGYRAYQRVREIAKRAAAGESRRQLRTEIYRLYNTVHEMHFDRGSEHFNHAVKTANDALKTRPEQSA